MADYKELIRRAIQALPENNGAARRAVYEKARAALVGQLRGLNPPLPARDITQHRLQLEDCIRQVEQEASEAVIAGLKQNENLLPPSPHALPAPRHAALQNPSRPAAAPSGSRNAPPQPSPRQGGSAAVPRPAAVASPRQVSPRSASPDSGSRVAAIQPQAANAVAATPLPRAGGPVRTAVRARTAPEPEPDYEDEPDTIEDIIAAAEGDSAELMDEPEQVVDDEPAPPMFRLEPRPARRTGPSAVAAPSPAVVPQQRSESRAVPAIVARAEAAKAGRPTRVPESGRRANGNDRHNDATYPQARQQPPTRQTNSDSIAVVGRNGQTAMSSIREVGIESGGDPQVAIERAIAALEREARGDDDNDAMNGAAATMPAVTGRKRAAVEANYREPPASAETVFARAPVENERGSGSAVTIFLLVFLLLLVGVGGGGLWAWREGYIDFDAMFGKSGPTSGQAAKPPSAAPTPAMQTANQGDAQQPASSSNTEAAPNPAAPSGQQLSASPTPAAAEAASTPAATPAEPSAQSGGPKSEERLTQSAGSAATPAAADAAKPAPDAATAAPGGSQSLLLEASQDGTTGAVPFSGTVEWSKGTDELGQPTLVGKANIPARNLGVNVLIRKNSDPTLPASHLIEINFSVTDSFIGGAISGLPGVLLKNEELVQGTPLVGASARVVGNSFLFALSSSAADAATNKDLLTSRKWIDLAIIYATGKKAIITLEKDDKAEGLFNDVFTAWAKEAPTPAAVSPAASTTSK